MTPAQIEAAARELCRMRGVDADIAVFTKGDDDSIVRSVRPSELFVLFAGEIRRFAEVGTAIAAALQQAEPKKRRKPARVDAG
jgi:hypothetical protein